VIVLTAGVLRAVIDSSRGFACTSLHVDDWDVLGPQGITVRFPWTGDRAARPARLRVGPRDLEFGGGPAGGLANEPWTMQSEDRVNGGTSVRARLMTDPSARAYPYSLVLSGTWRLDDEGLRLELELVNPNPVHAPFGLGIRVHLAAIGNNVLVLAPAEEWWQDDAPTPVGSHGGPDLRRPFAIAERIENRFTRRHFANLRTQVAVLAPAHGREIWLNTSSDFREVEIAVNPDGSGSLESATCTPDAFALHAAGVATGLRVLAPGETWRGSALLVAQNRPIG